MLPDTLTDNEQVFKGFRFDVHRVRLPQAEGSSADDPEARPVLRDVVVHPGAALAVPIMDDDKVVLIRNMRFAVDDTLWEVPCGTLEPNEDPIDCAARELIEESGYRAGRVEPLFDFYTTPGICTERMYAFAAYDLTHVGQNLDAGERITAEVVPLTEAIQMISDGRIVDGKTVAALLYYQAFRGRGPGTD